MSQVVAVVHIRSLGKYVSACFSCELEPRFAVTFSPAKATDLAELEQDLFFLVQRIFTWADFLCVTVSVVLSVRPRFLSYNG